MHNKFLHKFSIAVVVVCIVFFVHVILNNFRALPSLRYDSALAAAFFLSVGLVLVVYAIQVWTTYLLLCGLGEAPRLQSVLPTMLLSQFAKYLPGNISHFVGRVAIGKKYGYDAKHLLFTIGYEIGWAIVVSASVALFSFLYAGHEFFGNLPRIPSYWFIGLLIAVVLVIPPFATHVLNHWRHPIVERLFGSRSVKLPTLSITTACMLLYVLIFFINGLGLAILGEGLLGRGLENLILLIGLFSIAWLAGFVVPGAPGGLGVREAILVAGLSPLYGEPAAVALAIGSRLAFILGDGLAFLVGLIAYRRYPPHAASPETA